MWATKAVLKIIKKDMRIFLFDLAFEKVTVVISKVLRAVDEDDTYLVEKYLGISLGRVHTEFKDKTPAIEDLKNISLHSELGIQRNKNLWL